MNFSVRSTSRSAFTYSLFLLIAAAGSLLAACEGQDVQSPAETTAESAASEASEHATGPASQEQPGNAAADEAKNEAKNEAKHNGGHTAPIDCPLRAAGHDPTQMRPFDEVEEYIAFLERDDRATWQKPEAVVDALNLPEDAVVVDLGAGSGYFAFRIAKKVPNGSVEALDVEPEMVRHMHHKAVTTGVENLHAGFVDPEKPEVPDNASLVFICDVLHHVGSASEWLEHVGDQLPDGARLVLIEFQEGDLPAGPPEGAKIPRAQLLEMAQEAGLTLAQDKSELLPYQYMLIFEKGE